MEKWILDMMRIRYATLKNWYVLSARRLAAHQKSVKKNKFQVAKIQREKRAEREDTEEENNKTQFINTIHIKESICNIHYRSNVVIVILCINNKNIKFELDLGSNCSLISKSHFELYFPNTKYIPNLKTVSG